MGWQLVMKSRGPRVEPVLFGFVKTEELPRLGPVGTRIPGGLSPMLHTEAPRHRELHAVRDRRHESIDPRNRGHTAPRLRAPFQQSLRSGVDNVIKTSTCVNSQNWPHE